MKFTLPISPEYVAHWGLWEAVRELYQNALDQEDSLQRHSRTVARAIYQTVEGFLIGQ